LPRLWSVNVTMPVQNVERGSHMDRDHSSLIIILLGGILFVLGGILFVLLVGRDTAISVGRDVAIPVMGGAFGVALVVTTLALFIGY
jgi:hypothetical protein